MPQSRLLSTCMSPSPHFRNYCENDECAWSASTETHERDELAATAIEHATETGHAINSEVIADFSAHSSGETGVNDPGD